MASVEEHYKNLLAPYYSWSCGGSDSKLREYRAFFSAHNVHPVRSGVAVDLGAGCGFQSIPLAEAGFNVIAIDTSHELLAELKENAKDLPIEIIPDDLLNFAEHIPPDIEIIICMGDTLTHLNSRQEVRQLIQGIYAALGSEGLLILGFRDMTVELTGLDRFIPVRSDLKRIITCFLEFEKNYVIVHDLLYEKIKNQWNMKKSFFRKLRISRQWMNENVQEAGFKIETSDIQNGVVTIVACKR